MNANSKVLELTDQNFDEVVQQSDKPVMVDYWATYCGPCKMLSPIVEELAKEYEGSAVFGKLDVQKNMSGTKYGLLALPTIMIFKGGKKVEALTGVPTKAKLKEALQKHM